MLEVFDAGEGKGKGLRCKCSISVGEVVVEMVGEVPCCHLDQCTLIQLIV